MRQEGASGAVAGDEAEIERTVRAALAETTGLDPARVAAFEASTGLFGSLPEFDSMALAALLTALEEKLGILIEDHEVDAETMETFGGLLDFAKAKVRG
ncbi:MAG: phosphopantetheine-binding protein [Allosphingosinicella sp.]